MCKNKEYELFLENLQACATKEFQTTREYELRKHRQDHFDEMLSSNLTSDQKTFVEEILFEHISFCEREADLMYRQGVKDCVWLLKNLGVIA